MFPERGQTFDELVPKLQSTRGQEKAISSEAAENPRSDLKAGTAQGPTNKSTGARDVSSRRVPSGAPHQPDPWSAGDASRKAPSITSGRGEGDAPTSRVMPLCARQSHLARSKGFLSVSRKVPHSARAGRREAEDAALLRFLFSAKVSRATESHIPRIRPATAQVQRVT